MNYAHPNETQEWLDSRVESWVETYKKAMLTPVILQLVAIHQPATIAEIAQHVSSVTTWQITERGLYRTLKRLQDAGFLASEEVDAPRTGVKRKELSLTTLGSQLLSGINMSLISLPGAANEP